VFSLNHFSIEEILFILQEYLVRNLEESFRKDSCLSHKITGRKKAFSQIIDSFGTFIEKG